MAVARSIPTCSYCGEATATGRYKDESGVPPLMRIIGDTFLGWDDKECNCKQAIEARKNLRKEMDKWHKENPFDLQKAIDEKLARVNKAK